MDGRAFLHFRTAAQAQAAQSPTTMTSKEGSKPGSPRLLKVLPLFPILSYSIL